MEAADQVAALLVGMFGNRAAVDDTNVRLGRGGHAHEAAALELPGQRRALRKVELAAEGMETDSARLHVFHVFTGAKIRNLGERARFSKKKAKFAK